MRNHKHASVGDITSWVFMDNPSVPDDALPLADELEDEMIALGLKFMQDHGHEILQLIEVAETESVKVALRAEAVAVARRSGERLAYLN